MTPIVRLMHCALCGTAYLGSHACSTVKGLPRAATPQPPPAHNDKPSIHDLVIADMKARKAMGLAKYGTPLQAGNGRDALMDAYQEALDLCMYLKQAIEERDR